MGRGKGSPPLEPGNPAWNRLPRDRTIPTLSPLFPWKMGSRDRVSFIFRLGPFGNTNARAWLNVIFKHVFRVLTGE